MMRSFTMSTTQRNQVTIPGEVRHHLGIEPRDKVSFTIEDNGAVRLRKALFIIETVYGSVKAMTMGISTTSSGWPRKRRQPISSTR